jgi:hypothetical protein
VVIDAQLLAGLYRETIVGEAPAYSAATTDLFARLGSEDLGYMDRDGVIESEYRALVDPDWFDAWLGDRLQAGDFVISAGRRCPALLKILVVQHGFPRRSKDCRYIELCCGVVEATGEWTALISEDLDFYEPKAKAANSSYRQRVLASGRGPVARHLKKHEMIAVRTVAAHLAA